ncbi:Hypothetical protein PHPALM_11670 [Phytophthora palmivora]|uniref:Uncharacterized protein n=1 Tax=Phytophthora palmivora TaxID=4796 RepID=A0A2P4Y1P0_9STRA|nr:Hypothetical protein PHPALM_11670 [Phytophthora palmivora]
MECVIARNHALYEVDDPLTRALAAIKPVSSKPLVRYMRHVAVKVGERISQDMSDALGFMFDGRTCGTHHFVAIFGVFAKESKLQYILLAVSPAEFGQTDDAHIVMIGTVLEL